LIHILIAAALLSGFLMLEGTGMTDVFHSDAGITGLAVGEAQDEELSATVEQNQPPAYIGPAVLSTLQDTAFTIDLAMLFSDPEGGALTFIAAEEDQISVALDGSTATFTPAAGFAGERTLTIVASDGVNILRQPVKLVVEGRFAAEPVSEPAPAETPVQPEQPFPESRTAGFSTQDFPNCPNNDGNLTVASGQRLHINTSITCDNVTVLSGGVLIANSSANGNNSVNITAATITVNAGGVLTANGTGFNGGPVGTNGFGPGGGGGGGGGGGHGGEGGISGGAATAGSTYGSAFLPELPGSGGGGAAAFFGGAGGGSIVLSAAQISVNGVVSADGTNGSDDELGNSGAGGGSGGSVSIFANAINGSGFITVLGGRGGNATSGANGGGGGGGGRVFIRANSTTFNLSNVRIFSANRGNSTGGGANGQHGAPGTLGMLDVDDGALTVRHSWSWQKRGLLVWNFTTVNITNAITQVNDSSLDINASQVILQNGTIQPQVPSLNLTLNITAVNFSMDLRSLLRLNGSGAAGGAIGAVGDGPGGGAGGGGGGGHGGNGGTSGGGATGGSTHNSSLNPNELGSGGGGTGAFIGGNGGGVVLLSANSAEINGTISVEGMQGIEDDAGNTGSGGGSGGTIRIATNALEGNGTLTARGGRGGNTTSGANGGGGGGGGGRVIIRYNTTGYNFSNAFVTGGKGGNATGGGASGKAGEAGTLAFLDVNDDVLYIKEGWLWQKWDRDVWNFAVINLTNAVTRANDTTLDFNTPLLHLRNTSIALQNPEQNFTVNITATGFIMDFRSVIRANGSGYLGGPTSNEGSGPGGGLGGGSGAGHGGRGGAHGGGTAGGGAYNSSLNPGDFGSGGGGSPAFIGGHGGGVVLLSANSAEINGTISVEGMRGIGDDAGNTGSGGGSGGTINIITNTLTGIGNISATGGKGGNASFGANAGGGASGGRIIIRYNSSTFPINNTFAGGGLGGTAIGGGTSGSRGEPGTIALLDINDAAVAFKDGWSWLTVDAPFNFANVSANATFVRSNATRLTVSDTYRANRVNLTVLEGNAIINATRIYTPNSTFNSTDGHLTLVYSQEFNDSVTTYVRFSNLTIENRSVARVSWRTRFSANVANLSVRTRLGQNSVFVNVTNMTGMNVSANITLFGIAGTNPEPLVDFEDDGTFVTCPAATCVEAGAGNFTAGVYVFNVSRFTTYSSAEGGVNVSLTKLDSPDPVNASGFLNYTIVINVSGTQNASNVTLTDLYPAHIIFLDAQPSPTNGNNTFIIGNLTNGASFRVNISVLVNNVSNNITINNTANISYQNSTGNLLFFNVTESTNVTAAQTAAGNTAPTIARVDLNSTLQTTNDTNQNLTATIIGATDTDGHAVQNITDFRVNGTSIAVLNLPFENNTNTTTTGGVRDYSTYGNNGTLGNGTATNAPVWNLSGQVGGAYVFDGINDSIIVAYNESLKLNSSGATISVWAKPAAVPADTHNIISSGGTNYGSGWLVNQEGTSLLLYWLSSGPTINIPNFFAVDTWYHLVLTKNSTTVAFYYNGVLNSTATPGTNTEFNRSVFIGSAGGTAWPFNGTIDEVLIFNRSFSSAQVAQLYTNQNSSRHLTTIVAQETEPGQNWSVCATPNDNQSDGATVCSNNVTIQDVQAAAGDVNVTNCGVVLNGSAFLGSNVRVNGTCINITASNARLNCTGLNITGNGTGTGVKIPAGLSNVSIVNCNFINFSFGVFADPGGLIIENSTFENDSIGLNVFNTTFSIIRNNTFRNNTIALLINLSSDNNFTNNTFINNTASVWVQNSLNNTFNATLIPPFFIIENTSAGSINFTRQINITDNITLARIINITLNRTFVNTTQAAAFNASAQLTFRGIALTDPQAIVDFNDDGSFEACAGCTEISFANSVFVFNVTGFTTYSSNETITVQGCAVINVSTSLTQDITGDDTCIVINASNAVLDCGANEIRFNANGGNREFGISAQGVTNITVINCIIRDINETGTFGIGINVTLINASLFANNTIFTNGTTDAHGMDLGINAFLNTVQNNTIRTNGTVSADGLRLFTNASNNTVQNNTIIVNGTNASNNAILLLADAHNNTVRGNTITTSGFNSNDGFELNIASVNTLYDNIISAIGTGNNNRGFIIANRAAGNVIYRNTVTTAGRSGNSGFEVRENASRNIIENNTIIAQGMGANTNGLQLRLDAHNNTFRRNIITTRGNGTNSHGIQVQDTATSDNLFEHNVIRTNETGAYAVNVTSNRMHFAHNLFNDTVEWIQTANVLQVNFTNTTFEMPDGSINILPLVQINGTQDVSKARLNVSFNNSYLNTTNLTFFNTSAIITLRGITFSDPRPTVDFEDDGTFANCAASQCQEVSFANNVYAYNVTSFTSYSSGENASPVNNSCPGDIYVNTTLTSNVSSNGTCVTFNASNIFLDCANFTITYGINGSLNDTMGVNISNMPGAVVRNCVIVRGNDSGARNYGIGIFNTHNVTIANNTITTNGTSEADGIHVTGEAASVVQTQEDPPRTLRLIDSRLLADTVFGNLTDSFCTNRSVFGATVGPCQPCINLTSAVACTTLVTRGVTTTALGCIDRTFGTGAYITDTMVRVNLTRGVSSFFVELYGGEGVNCSVNGRVLAMEGSNVGLDALPYTRDQNDGHCDAKGTATFPGSPFVIGENNVTCAIRGRGNVRTRGLRVTKLYLNLLAAVSDVQRNATSLVIDGNTVVADSIVGARGVYSEMQNANVTLNTIVTVGGNESHGILYTGNRTRVHANNVSVREGVESKGVFGAGENGNITGNRVIVQALDDSVGIAILANRTDIIGNTVVTAGGNQSHGILARSSLNRIRDNTMTTNETGEQSHGIAVEDSVGNTVTNNNIGANGTSSAAIRLLNTIGNSLLNNTIVFSRASSVRMEQALANVMNGTNIPLAQDGFSLEILDLNGTIYFTAPINITNLTNFSQVVRIAFNSTLVNTTHSAGQQLNATASLEIYNLSAQGTRTVIDRADSGVFVNCDEPQCRDRRYGTDAGSAGGTLTFNVSSFTTYAAQGISACGTLDDSNTVYTLFNDVNASTTCFTLVGDNTTLSCGNFTIYYDANGSGGHGIDAIGNNIAVENCTIIDINASGANGIGINLSSANDSLIRNNRIVTNGTSGNIGINLRLNVDRAVIANNTVNGTGTTNGRGIALIGGIANNVVADNVIWLNGSSGLNGIRIDGAGSENNTVLNNTATVSGNSSENAGILVSSGTNNTLLFRNTLLSNGTNSNRGIYLNAIEGATVANNTVAVRGSSTRNYGIFLDSAARNATLANNTITTVGTGNDTGILMAFLISDVIVVNNSINVSANAGDGHGVELNTTSQRISVLQNTIRTNGTAFTNGVRVSSSSRSTVSNNLIVANGSANDNYGVFLSGASNITLDNNTILTAGTGNNTGLRLSGAVDNLIRNNTVSTGRTTGDNRGTHLSSSSTRNTVLENRITTDGTARNDGALLQSSNGNTLRNNTFVVQGSAADNYGMRVLGGSFNVIANNTVRTTGTSANYGIVADSTAPSNVIANNTVRAGGTGSSNYGVFITGSSSDHNNVTGNRIATNGTSSNFGVYVFDFTDFTRIRDNLIETNGTSSDNYGTYIQYVSTTSDISNNTIVTNGTSNNEGIVLFDFAQYNTVANNTIRVGGSASDNTGIFLNFVASDNNITGNRITTNGTFDNEGMFMLAFAENNDISNNTITTDGTANFNVGIFMHNITRTSRFVRNVIDTHGTDNNIGFYIQDQSDNNRVENNTVRTGGSSGFNIGINVQDFVSGTRIYGNTVTTNGTFNNEGMRLYNFSIDGVVSNNTITADGSGVQNIGLNFNLSYGNTVTSNAITTNGRGESTFNAGILEQSSSFGNTIANNTITARGNGTLNHGIQSAVFGTNITNNVISTNGSSLSHGVNLIFSENTRVENNSVTATGGDSDAVRMEVASTNFIRNNTLAGFTRFALHLDRSLSNVINQSLLPAQYGSLYVNESNGSIRWFPALNITNATNMSQVINVSFNRIFLNATDFRGSLMNHSADLEFRALTFTNPSPIFDLEDDSAFIDCPVTRCVERSYVGGVFFYNVTSWTAYSSTETGGLNVTLTKSDSPDPVSAGAQLNYTITLNITGNTSAGNVTLTELFPPQVIFLNSQPPNSTGNNTFIIGNRSNGSTFTLNISVLVNNGTDGIVLNNTANISFQNSTGQTVFLNVTENTTVSAPTAIVNLSNISIAKSDTPDPVQNGSQLNYTILVSSTGNATAFNVTVIEVYPAQSVFSSAQPGPLTGTNNTFVLGNLTPGTNITLNITVNVTPDASGTLTNTVNASFQNETSQVQVNRSASASTTVSTPTPPPPPPPAAGGGGGWTTPSVGGVEPQLPAPVSSGCAPRWECGDWGLCVGGRQERNCVDTAGCNATGFMPPASRPCREHPASAGIEQPRVLPLKPAADLFRANLWPLVFLILMATVLTAAYVQYRANGGKLPHVPRDFRKWKLPDFSLSGFRILQPRAQRPKTQQSVPPPVIPQPQIEPNKTFSRLHKRSSRVWKLEQQLLDKISSTQVRESILKESNRVTRAEIERLRSDVERAQQKEILPEMPKPREPRKEVRVKVPRIPPDAQLQEQLKEWKSTIKRIKSRQKSVKAQAFTILLDEDKLMRDVEQPRKASQGISLPELVSSKEIERLKKDVEQAKQRKEVLPDILPYARDDEKENSAALPKAQASAEEKPREPLKAEEDAQEPAEEPEQREPLQSTRDISLTRSRDSELAKTLEKLRKKLGKGGNK
jgi:hypothetical protein